MSTVSQLIVMRHAKTEPFHADDRSRRLTDRGESDARAAGVWLTSQALVPDLVLVSPATRARQTVEQVAAGADEEPEVLVVDDLYGADVDDVLDILRDLRDAPDRLMVVGHNPTMAYLAQLLDDGTGDEESGREMATGFPTGALASFEVSCPWVELDLASARLVAFHVGRA